MTVTAWLWVPAVWLAVLVAATVWDHRRDDRWTRHADDATATRRRAGRKLGPR